MTADPPDDAAPPRPNLAKRLGTIALIALIITAVAFLPVGRYLQDAQDWVGSLGVWGPAAFVGLYIVACVFGLPGSVLTVGAGALFGLLHGTIIVSIGSTLGATAAFLVGRYLARGWVESKIAGSERFAAIDEAVGREGFKIVLLTRLSPVFPFTLLNFGYGVTRVRVRDYMLASWIGMIPGTVLYVYLGTLAETATSETTTGQIVLRVVGLLATIAVTVYVTRIARRALAAETGVQTADAA